MAKRKRRSFTTEFKAQAVRVVRESGKPVGTVARELDLTETALRSWVRQAEIDAGGRGTTRALTTEEREEHGRLRREDRTLQMERDILKKRRPSSRRRIREVSIHRHGEGPVPSARKVEALITAYPRQQAVLDRLQADSRLARRP